ncbi:helix-turn-helix transcriptional regulator [Adlercreutzia sp.]|uniref:helix-turn-helix transcriptional regulator n=1 Tax=Adlercreutzia sp. TaxID=1872387 RepID=UPI002E790644|nr:helix-turn-helix transcriptional regulator [Adlercreutzia sp.]MEE0637703.1 helix-turn-helix transcriptional regulator [Adlercreutzia sp.]
METAFYLYTIVVMLACVASGSVSLSAYFVSRRRSFLYAALMLLFYFLDLALIFQYEYLGQNVEYSITQFYTIDHPQLKMLLALGTLESMWLILCDFVNEKRRAWRIVPAVVFVVATEIVLWALPVSEFRQWLFYTLRQGFLIWCIAYAVYRYSTSQSEVERARMRRQEPVLLVTAVLCLCILIEDVAMILVFDSSFFAQEALLPLYISERNFSENILLLAFAFFTLRAAADTLRLRFKEPPAVDAPDTQAYVDELLPAFCERYNLTARERVIVEQVLQGKDNQNIASSLQLALGTVKAHVHNILKKTGVSTRQELTQLFWKG